MTFCPTGPVTLGPKFCLSTIGSPNLLQLKLEECVKFTMMYTKVMNTLEDFKKFIHLLK